MTQSDFGTIDPNTKGGSALATDLNNFRDALNTMHSGSSAPSYVQAGMVWADTTSATEWVIKQYDGSGWIELWRLHTTANLAGFAGGFKSVQVFSTAGADTWTRPTGINKALAIITGAGGGGGDANCTTNSTTAAAAGGRAGDTKIVLLDVSGIGTSTLNIGAGGAGATTAGASGSAGGATTWSDGTNSYEVVGGGGGGGEANRTNATAKKPTTTTNGTDTATGTTPILELAGEHGGDSLSIPSSVLSTGTGTANGGAGGASYWGKGGTPGVENSNTTDAGGNASNPGAGGGGGAAMRGASSGGGSANGGDGADGIIVVFEYQ